MLEVTNQRTGEVLPLYPDILDDLDRNAASLDIAAAAGRITAPWLIIHGLVDETVPAAEARALSAAAPAAELLLIEHTGHTFGAAHPLTTRTPALEQVFDASLAFLSRHLL
jgi:pimeloyl-ACP methyl ester carboxylesterase